MSAAKFYDDELVKRVYREQLLERLRGPILSSPEWRAWAKEWLETVPLMPEQVQENADWKARLPKAHEDLAAELESLRKNIEVIEAVYGVKIEITEDGEYEVNDYDPPHRPSSRPKAGAPEAPPIWPTGGGTVKFRRSPDMV